MQPTPVSTTGNNVTEPVRPKTLRERIRAWLTPKTDTTPELRARDLAADEAALEERRQRLLAELAHAVADAPDDVPIQEVIRRLNHHDDD